MFKRLALVAATLAALAAPTAHAFTVSTFVTSGDLVAAVGNDDTIGFAYAGNKFVGSIYHNGQLYQTDLTGHNVQKFGAALPFSTFDPGEIYVSSSLGLGGFASRAVFAGSQNQGTVWTYANNATTATAATAFVTGLNGGVRSIAFDPYGLYGNDMIVATFNGFVYRVKSDHSFTVLASGLGDTEGLDFAPQAFGSHPAGTLFVLSEGTGLMRAISPTGVVTNIMSFNTPEMLAFVPLDFALTLDPLAGFYAARFPTDIGKAGFTEFAPFAGQAVVTEENSHDIFAIKWDTTTNSFVKTLVGNLGAQPEDGIFVTAAIIDPGCTIRGDCGQGTVSEPEGLATVGLGLAAMAAVGLRRRRAAR